MLNQIILSSIRLRSVVIGLTIAMVVLAFAYIKEIPVDVFPEFGEPTVEIQTEALGLSAEEVKSLVTLNIEELLAGVPWVTSMRSESLMGLSSIKLTFERGTDLMEARQMVSERLTLAYALPNISDPPQVIQPQSTTNRLMMVGLRSDDIEPTQLSILTKWVIKPRLLGVPGVSNIAVWGLKPKEMQIQVDPRRLRDARLIQDDVIDAAGNALWVTPLSFLKGHSPGTGGFIDHSNQRLGIHHKMPIIEPEDMAKVPVTPKHLLMTGKLMDLGDISEVLYSHPPLIGDAIVNNQNGMILVLDKLPSANTIEVTKNVNAALADLKHGLPGITLDTNVFQLSTYVETSLNNLLSVALAGITIMAIVIGLLLMSWRATLVSLISILAPTLTALIIVQIGGGTLNTMVISGLIVALGITVGDTITDIVQIMQYASKGGRDIDLVTCIRKSLSRTKSVAIFSLLAITLAGLPVFFMGGIAGAFMEPLMATYLLAVISSWFIGLTLTPALVFWLFSPREADIQSNNIYGFLRQRFESLTSYLSAKTTLVVILGVLVIASGLLASAALSFRLLPEFSENNVVIQFRTAPGTSLKETTRITSRMANELHMLDEVRQVNAHIGRAISGDQIVNVNEGQIWLTLNSDISRHQSLKVVTNTVKGYPGVDTSVQSYLRNTISQVISGQDAPIVIRIYGQELKVLESKAEEIRSKLNLIEELENIRIAQSPYEPQINVQIDVDAAAKAGVKPGDVRRSAATIFSGINVGFLFEEQKLFDVAVWSPPEIRKSITDLENILVEKSDRSRVRLGDIASIKVVPMPVSIRHENISAYIDIMADSRDGDIHSTNQKINGVLNNIDFPLEYHPELLGENTEQLGIAERISSLILIAIIGIFLLLQARFNNWKATLFAFLSIPAAISGGVLTVLLTGASVTLGTVIGFLALLGITTRYVIIIIDNLQNNSMPGGDYQALISSINLMPVFVSVMATISVLLPIAVFGGIPGLEIIASSAQVIVGGMVFSTLFTLLVIPAFYSVFQVNLEPALEIDVEITANQKSI